MKQASLLCAAALGAWGAAAQAQIDSANADGGATRLPPIVTETKPWNFNRETRFSHLLPEVDGTHITVTKKNTVIDLDEQPTVIDNNQRALFERMPGLLISEQQNPGQLNINYRGIGGNGPLGAQESELLLSLQDGIPFASDWIGFPTTYFLPWPQSIASVQFVRGSSGLLYGPEPAALNYISRAPSEHPFAASSEQVLGSDRLYSTFNTVSGTQGDWNYRINADYRRSDGERSNGQYYAKGGDLHLGYRIDAAQKLAFDLHLADVDTGEAGRMSFTQFQADEHFTVTPVDHLWTQRYTGVVTYSDAPSEALLLETKAWAGYQDLAERTAPGPTPPGTIPATVNLADQVFHYAGIDSRARLRWGRGNALSAGAVYYSATSPRFGYTTPNVNAAGNDRNGTLTLQQERGVRYGALFAENVFRFGRFHVVPSVRLEREMIDVNEIKAPGARPAIHQVFARNVPLLGLGFGNDFGRGNETYFNIAQGYRPMRYLEVAPTSASVNPSLNNPAPGKMLTYEAGVHGWPVTGLYYDVSIYQTRFKNRFETLGTAPNQFIANSGDTRHRGAELQLDYDLLRLTEAAPDQHLSVFTNASYLDAEFTASRSAGIFIGNEPGYAPHYIVREGLLWRRDHAYKVSLSAASVGSQYWQDSNAGAGGTPAKIPSYTLADFGADWWVTKNLRVLGGVSNLLDRKYYSRVLFGGGIEPGVGRNYYAGLAVEF